MKPSLLVIVLCLGAAACDSGPRFVVRASLGGRPVAELPLTLLPYDRERLQDSLRSADDDPPTLPQDLLRQLSGVDSALARPPADSAAMARVDSLRGVRDKLSARLDSARQRVARWEAALVRRADSVGTLQAEGEEREAAVDTTDASGRATLASTPGPAWIRARYVLPDAIMEWNVPVTLPAGQDSVVVQLDERNGRRRRD
jgi:hypothetical protein